MGSVEYDTERYLDELDRPTRGSMWDDEDFLYDLHRDDPTPYLFNPARCTEPAARMVHEAAMCVAMMNSIRWGIETHSVIPEAA